MPHHSGPKLTLARGPRPVDVYVWAVGQAMSSKYASVLARTKWVSARSRVLTCKPLHLMLVEKTHARSESLPVISDPFEQIRKRFSARCLDDLDRLRGLRTSGIHLEKPEAFSALSAIAHSLAGACGTRGFPEISEKAFKLESILIAGNFDESVASALDELIAELEKFTRNSS